jgi:hypothetical protein
MPSKKPAITVTVQSEDGPLQVEVAIPLRPRHPKPSRDPQIAPTRESPGPPRIPRVTRLMALAIKFQAMVEHGEVRDYADLARLGYVTRARLTQIMNLLLLAPDIQEQILFMDASQRVLRAVTERELRSFAPVIEWDEQRRRFRDFARITCPGGTRQIISIVPPLC